MRIIYILQAYDCKQKYYTEQRYISNREVATKQKYNLIEHYQNKFGIDGLREYFLGNERYIFKDIIITLVATELISKPSKYL